MSTSADRSAGAIEADLDALALAFELPSTQPDMAPCPAPRCDRGAVWGWICPDDDGAMYRAPAYDCPRCGGRGENPAEGELP